MAIIGHTGSVTVAGNVGSMDSAKAWSIDVAKETVDITSFGSGGWKESVSTLKSWTGSLTAIFDASGADEVDLIDSLTGASSMAASFQLGTGTGTYDVFSGNVNVTGMSIVNDVNGIVEATFNFEGTGALAIA